MDIIEKFTKGKLAISIFNATAEELDTIEQITSLKYGTGKHLSEKMNYASDSNNYIYVNPFERCIYLSWGELQRPIEELITVDEFLDTVKPIKEVKDNELMELFL